MGLDSRTVLGSLTDGGCCLSDDIPPADVADMSLTELVNHIEATHHAYLREELPRLPAMTYEAAYGYGDRDRRLHQVHETMRVMAFELWCHMLKEERCLFPMIRQLEADDGPPMFRCGTIADPICQMELDHEGADVALEQLKELTDGFSPPEWACAAHRVLLAALAHFERDMHRHIHKENNVLFPRALEMERQKEVLSNSAISAMEC